MPINGKLSAEPLQPVNAYILKQTLRWFDARVQAPADNVPELLQADGSQPALFVNQTHQLNC